MIFFGLHQAPPHCVYPHAARASRPGSLSTNNRIEQPISRFGRNGDYPIKRISLPPLLIDFDKIEQGFDVGTVNEILLHLVIVQPLAVVLVAPTEFC